MPSPTSTTLPNGTTLPYTYRGLSLNTHSSTNSNAASNYPATVDLGLDSPKTGMPPSPQLDSGYVNPRTYPATFTAPKARIMDPRRTSLASKGADKVRGASISDPRSPVNADNVVAGGSASASSSPTETGSASGSDSGYIKQPLGTVREVEPYFDEPEAAKNAESSMRRESEAQYTLSSPMTNVGPAPVGWGESRRRSSAFAFAGMGSGRRRSSVMDSIKSYIKPGAPEEAAEVV